MKNQILNIGKALNKAEQKKVTGGCYGCTPGGSGNNGSGSGGSSGGSTCSSVTTCSPGKCFSLQTCRCAAGYPNPNGTCA